MKKCPFCAEKIQDEAIVCRYCGHDLPVTSELIDKNTSQGNGKPRMSTPSPKHSAWAQGAKVAAVLTVLAAIGIYIHYQNSPAELIGGLVLGSVVNFLGWWLIITGIIALWRNEHGKIFILTIVALLVLAGFTILGISINRNTSSKSTSTSTPTPIPTTTPSLIPTNTRLVSGDVILSDNFSRNNGNFKIGNSDAGAVSYKNLGLSIDISKANTLVYSLFNNLQFFFNQQPPLPSNVRIEVDATLISGTDNNVFGILCRFMNVNSYYFLGITSKGLATIQKNSNGQWIPLLKSSDAITFDNINKGRNTNHLRADCIGNELTLYVNSMQAASAVDGSYLDGNVGLVAGSYESIGTEILFDNFYIYVP